jgi:hypothetical protein
MSKILLIFAGTILAVSFAIPALNDFGNEVFQKLVAHRCFDVFKSFDLICEIASIIKR